MGQQRMKEDVPEEKKKEKPERPREPKERVAKKWKGKDWFSVLAPESFGGNVIAETPATDPKTLMGRNVEVSLSDLLGQSGKDYQKLVFMVCGVEGRNARTRFNGYTCVREFISRFVRKRLQKIEVIGNVRTKDGWLLQVSSVAIMNRNVEKQVEKKVRAWVGNLLSETAGRSVMDEFVKFIMAGSIQHKAKKQGSRIYPVRFFEISKIEVVKLPD